ncbi:MAG: bifunctional phosphopantothenoylcysteine decarboxylase/phosphopantothenate--cysteine ligase CoaBC [Saprospiraceae bacterium]|nr:bifunctional phosphopantothenoylcysteine decarboxylase/phosphopantothenate--cysteine ligase CoaBC [Candidatus Vicinibacter proximus]MBL7823945.1 bifunctional phosphopantothenoylcysteine decarboxylase/phosphopantothenate--cysteine ligase CoaBC [Saprospiraceae bacterium]MCC6842037.1 bifunctional phosphopantothenoylcysteine decarboxylase/phosphopantothenate--cysteine ligase CoaBC [Saprospiraceae bacterium]HRG32730.1 bifunctional phosphopantothenoylcysteine decarboxylase/phosphopantothenate--cyst
MNALTGKKIILGVTGSISAYKSLILLRLLTKAGAEVKVIMTNSAMDFVGPLSFSTLSGQKVLNSLSNEQEWQNHVHLGLWADLLLVAPISAQSMAKFTLGLVDNLLTAVFLSAKCPVMIAPAMDLDMWKHPSTQNNLEILKQRGVKVVPVAEGILASGLSGPGRLAEPEEIMELVLAFFDQKAKLKHKKILITAGPTYESIDPVRFIGNFSSGKMGIRLAEVAASMGAEVTLVLGPANQKPDPSFQIEVIHVVSAEQMLSSVSSKINHFDYFILAAAVADYKPENPSLEKIKKTEDSITLKLVKNPDIAAFIGEKKQPNQRLIGFALETQNIVNNAQTKLDKKNMDMIVINSPKDEGAGFGFDTNKIQILKKSGELISFELKSKEKVAIDILEEMIKL